ncbi:MAG: glycosyltransferase family 9 protein [Leptolyngbyaceae cyanobacterium SL_7_1]|nr:glycosyltransferase family 9 protein [Leptolyngbyaceae cyanobacterium SL_7_1]
MNAQLTTLPINRVAIVRSLPGLGDFLCVIPALRALRSTFPQAQFTWIGLSGVRSLVERFSHYLDNWLEFPGCPGIPEVALSAKQVVTTLSQWQQQPFDLAMQLHGSGVAMNAFVALMGATHTAGFYLPDHYCPDRDRFLPYPVQEPEVWRHLRLLEFLGVPLQGDQLEFPVDASDRQNLAAVFSSAHPYVCLHPGASVAARRWSPANFAHVGNALAAQGWRVVLTGTAAEVSLTQAIADSMQGPVTNLAGKTSLGAIAALLKEARLLVCNDTGISHLAAALRVPSVVVFSQSDPQRWAPLDGDRHRAIVIADAPQRFQEAEQRSSRRTFPVVSPAASVSVVLATAMQQLQQEVVYAF